MELKATAYEWMIRFRGKGDYQPNVSDKRAVTVQ